MRKEYKISGFADEIADDLTTQIESLRKLDIHYVEMRGVDGNNLIYHTDEKIKEIRARLDDAGISLSAMGTPLGKIGIEEPFEKHFEEFKRAIEVAHMMGTRNLRMFSFYMPAQNADRHDYRERVFERIGAFADEAASGDVIFLHENEKDIYGEKAPECLDLMKNFASEHFKAIFDFANFVQAGQDTLEAYAMLKDYIAYIHVKDARWGSGTVVPSGYGDGHVEEILKDLFDSGFDGYLSIEPHLFGFRGFSGLERSNVTPINETGDVVSGFEGFRIAHESLLKILDTIA
ncbi:MAG: sugar phosphate isomerase/epimerase [Lachnospiraceae bacterium]|nr:sugar phosphate isomerase/epimerase [Lachnospiraceae bacterium]